MNLRDFEYIIAVADEEHFGRASDKCNVSQPALSGQIKKLEETLGVKVFERTNRRVSVTPIGREIVEKARHLLAMADEIRDTAAAASDPLAGHIRLGTIPTIGPYLLPSILRPIKQALPKLDISLAEDVTQSLERRLILGDIDVAITATVTGVQGVESIDLYTEPFLAALPEGHALCKIKKLNIEDLDSAELLLLRDGHCLSDQVAELCGLARGQIVALDTQASSLETIIGLVAAGTGITLLPSLAASQGGGVRSKLIIRPIDDKHAARAIRLVFRESYPKRELIEVIADVIKSCAKEIM
jgi:LysR family hydrogen peroxide-inducible transcriptional activator